MRDLPTGTVTLLFTDVEGSTRLLTDLGDGYAEVLAEHRRALRGAFERHGGVEVDTQGDAFFVAFADAEGAVGAAGDAQRALAGGPVRVRMGVHTGEPSRTDDGYVGLDVHRAARICAVAYGGQVVLSDRTRRLLEPAVEVSDLGLHRLKDIPEPERLYQLGGEAFPPLRSLNATNLPSQASPLIGRVREVAELVPLARGHRVVTLTGPGGSGKTRLALEIAADLVGDFPDGVFWASLAPVTDPDLLATAIGQAIGARETLAEHVDEKRMLLLLDNFEQLLTGAPAIAQLVASCPNLHLLVTSRAQLRIAGEREYPVEPLLESDAVTLFRERAIQSEPVETVAAICRRLDDLPLAIELAAARTRALSPVQLLERLDARLPLLTSGRRDAPERQRTLGATIAWSYELLRPAEQRLFARLAVFSGGFTPESAEEVCGGDIDALDGLVEQSLARRAPDGRLGMLETVREFASERLEASGELDRMHRRHAEWCLALVRSANLSSDASAELRPDRVLPEQDNVRAALTWSRDAGERELGLEIVLLLELVWHVSSPFELASWLETFAPEPDALPLDLRARVLRVGGAAAEMNGDWASGEALYRESLLCYRMLDDERGIAELLTRTAESARRRGDLLRARALAEEAVQVARRLGDRMREAPAVGILGHVEYDDGHYEQGIALVEESVAISADVGFVWWQGVMLGGLAEYLSERGRTEEARTTLQKALRLLHRAGDRQNTLWALAETAKQAADGGALEDAGRLWGSVEAEGARAPLGWWRLERPTFEALFGTHQDDPDFARGLAEGRGLTLDEAVARALSEP